MCFPPNSPWAASNTREVAFSSPGCTEPRMSLTGVRDVRREHRKAAELSHLAMQIERGCFDANRESKSPLFRLHG